MKVTFWKVLGLIGLLAEELTKAAQDGKITVREALSMVKKICKQLGIDFDTEGFDVG